MLGSGPSMGVKQTKKAPTPEAAVTPTGAHAGMMKCCVCAGGSGLSDKCSSLLLQLLKCRVELGGGGRVRGSQFTCQEKVPSLETNENGCREGGPKIPSPITFSLWTTMACTPMSVFWKLLPPCQVLSPMTLHSLVGISPWQ